MRTISLSFFLLFTMAVFGKTVDGNQLLNIAENTVIEQSTSNVYQAQTTIVYYQVHEGDNIGKIAKLHDVEVDDIKRWNNLYSENLAEGTELKIQKIDFVLIEAAQLQEPEFLAIENNEYIASEIMNVYLDKVAEGIRIQEECDKEQAARQIVLYAEYTTKEQFEHKAVKEKNLWNRISNTGKNAFASVKNWSGSMIDKIKGSKDTEVFFAENENQLTEENKINEVPENQLSILNEPLSLVEETHNIIYPQGDSWKKIYHKVKFGETVTQIASRYHVSKDDIISWNNLSSGMAKVRQRLLIFVPKDYGFVSN